MIETPRFLPETNELSVYTGRVLDKSIGKELATRVAVAFPEMSPAKAMLLIEMMIDEQFTEQRGQDAVKQVVKQHVAWGKEPPIGAFISYDRRAKLYTGSEIQKLHDDGAARWSDFAIARIEGVSGCRSAGPKPVRFIRRVDAEMYSITTTEPKEQGKDWKD